MTLSSPPDTASKPNLALMISGHGSRDPEGVAEFRELMGLIRERAKAWRVGYGFLEFASPTIDESLRELAQQSPECLVMVPGVLLRATHAKNDMPAEMQAMSKEFPGLDMRMAGVLGLSPRLLRVLQERVIEAEAASPQTLRRDQTLLLVVGRGTSDPEANGDISKLTRMLEEGMGFGASLVCYAGTAKPALGPGLEAAARLGFERVLVLPFFLFTGVLVKRIRAATEVARKRHPDVEFLDAGYLGVHEELAELFIERAEAAIDGALDANCALCKYRTNIVGFEEDVGSPQISNHTGVKGLLAKPQAPPPAPIFEPYVPHPIEAESYEIISKLRDWSQFDPEIVPLLQRLVHTSGNPDVVDDVIVSPGAVKAGTKALLRGMRIVCDVTMVQAGLKRSLLQSLEISTWCGVHDKETHLMSKHLGITRSAAGMRRAAEKFGNNVILAIGDAPTAVMEVVRLIREQNYRPQLVVGIPVGFVGTEDCKTALSRTLQVPRITNRGTQGGSTWAATLCNAMLIMAQNEAARRSALEAET